MTRLEDDLGAALRALVPDDVPATDLARRVPRVAARRRVARRTVLVAAVPAALGAAVAGERLLDDRRRAAGPAGPPPPVDLGRPHVVVVPATVPPGSTVALWVAQPEGTDLGLYGEVGRVERWTGSRWVEQGTFTGGVSGITAGTLGPATGVAVPSLGLTAAGGRGPVELVDLAGLAPGTYRVGHGGERGTAWGLVTVDPQAPPPPQVAAPEGSVVGVAFDEPVLDVGTAATGRLVVWEQPGEDVPADVVGTLSGRLSGPGRLERWSGDGWQDTGRGLPVRQVEVMFAVAADVDVPALGTGTYRVVVTGSVAGPMAAPLWVVGP